MDDQSELDEAKRIKVEATEALEILERIAEDRGLLAKLPVDVRHRLLKAAGTIAFPGRNARRQLTHGLREQRRAERAKLEECDNQILNKTGIRLQNSGKFKISTKQVSGAPKPLRIDGLGANGNESSRVKNARNCYICKQDYHQIHSFYDSLCPQCADQNWQKRNQTSDLSERFAIVTGARVKIGFEAALKLLRAGATVVVTTRFPNDAANRYAREDDHHDWSKRLLIHGIDLRHTPSVESLAAHLLDTLPRLDFILNNACQTVRRPPGFYAHLIEGESALARSLSEMSRPWLESHFKLTRESTAPPALATSSASLPESFDHLVGINQASLLSQLRLTKDDIETPPEVFPNGALDADCQQVDLRSTNSWRLRLADISTVELLEVQLVNAIAPFILNSRLKPLMQRVATQDKHIVNVSAMEGVFYRAYKTDKHPHTNMAKAALNMMTRTSAQDYIKNGIHMNSVDTGWITDEDPVEIAERKKDEHGFHPPLDIVDGAARICDPIFSGINTGNHVWGQFLKDYGTSNW